jgi:hypothetical protein
MIFILKSPLNYYLAAADEKTGQNLRIYDALCLTKYIRHDIMKGEKGSTLHIPIVAGSLPSRQPIQIPDLIFRNYITAYFSVWKKSSTM